MSRRGGGTGGRRSQQPPPSPAAYPPAQRGGRGGGGGRRGGGGGAGSTYQRSVTEIASSSAAPPSAVATSSSATSLSRDVERLALQASTPVIEAPTPQTSTPVIEAPTPQTSTPVIEAPTPQTSTPVIDAPTPQAPAPSSSRAIRFPVRPGYGTVGSKCLITANHFLVQIADRDLHQYDVTITPEVLSKGVNRKIMAQLVEIYRESHLRQRKPVYDGRKSIYTAGALPFISKEFIIKLPEDDKPDRLKKDREFRVTIKFASKPDLHHLKQFLKSRQTDAPYETIQALDVVLREYPSREYNVVGRSFFSLAFHGRSEIGEGLECWRGFYQSIRPTQMGMSLNIDVSATSFYEAISVVDFVRKYLNIRDLSKPLSDADRGKIKKALRGVRVQVNHMEHVKRYKVSGITTLPMNRLFFPVDDKGTKNSVPQYFNEKYKIRLQNVSWPCLQAGSDSKPIYLPMEVCSIVEGQRFSKKLNEKQVATILKMTCKRPIERESSIVQIVRQNKYSEDEFALEFGMEIKNTPAVIEARVLPAPMLKYHDTGREKNVHPRVGQWNMINMKMVNGATVANWTCVSFATRLNHDIAYRFFDDLIDMCASKGMVFNPRPVIDFHFARPDQIERTLTDIHTQSTKKLESAGVQEKRLQLLIIILPDVTGSYGKIKRLCETELGIVSQCCKPQQVAKGSKQYLENVALKINVKTGGRNTVLMDAIQRRIPLVTDYPTIIFGADVTHPQPGEDSSPSIAAVVASMDWPEVTKYRGLVSAQPHRQELIDDLYKVVHDPQRGPVNGGMIRELLIAFRRSTGHKPHRIIFYRDGVSEGQFNQVLLHEMDAIRKACSSLEEGYLPPVTFVVVQKRHHTRLFPRDHKNRALTDKSGNILPGTVVDTTICHPTEFDFYLCSHAGIQGTSRPTHYHVLWDENRFTADALQTLTNNLCYTYARCTRSVSVVPPAYYAHLAAFRARHYIEGETSDGGSGPAGGGMRERIANVRPLPQIKENVKDVMFYC